MTIRAFGGIHAAAILSLAAFVGAEESQPSDDRVYEVIELTIGFTEQAYAAAPCEGCLDERGALQAAGKYLHEIGLVYEALRTERWDHFAWCGLDAEEVVKTKLNFRFNSDATIADYFRDHMFYDLRTSSEDPKPCASETWRVWYRIGWLQREYVELAVEAGIHPVDELAVDVPLEKSFLIHARTGMIAGVGHLTEPEQRMRDAAARQLVVDWTRDRSAEPEGGP